MPTELELYERYSIRRIGLMLHVSPKTVKARILTQGGVIGRSGGRRLGHVPDLGPRCPHCGILFAESGDVFHENDPPDSEICWYCREERDAVPSD